MAANAWDAAYAATLEKVHENGGRTFAQDVAALLKTLHDPVTRAVIRLLSYLCAYRDDDRAAQLL